MYDYEPAHFLAGPVIPVSGDPEYPARYVVMQVAVDRVLVNHDDTLVHEGVVYVPVPQGAADAAGKPARDLGDFEAAIPAGTDAVLLLSTPRSDLADFDRSLPQGARLAASGVQGMYLDDCGKLVGGFDDLVPFNKDEIDTLVKLEAAINDLVE